MGDVIIIKAGSTFPELAKRFGDFDTWVGEGLNLDAKVVDAERFEPLPDVRKVLGAVITGSHAMVTEGLPWSLEVEAWLPLALKAQIPILGICYGHQLLARALGGTVGFHPNGKEIGTVRINRFEAGASDPLFHAMPPDFLAHVTHSQSVRSLPAGAIALAGNPFEPNQAFRMGDNAWGVQFHPEFDPEIMRSYILAQEEALKRDGFDLPKLLDSVAMTPQASEVLRSFGRIVR